MLALGERVRVFIWDNDAIPPVPTDKMRAQAIPRVGGTCTTGKGAGAPLFCPREAHVIYLWVVLRMTDRKPVTVYY